MATIIDERESIDVRANERAARVITSGGLGEGFGGAVAALLAILGLCGLTPIPMAAIGGILIGAGLAWESAMMGSQRARIPAAFPARVELASGLGVQFLGGFAGLVLCVIALLRLTYALSLISTAVLIFACVLAAGSVATQLAGVEMRLGGDGRVIKLAGGPAIASVEVLIGFGAGILAVLGLVGIATLTLSLVALLGIGLGVTFSGTAVSARVIRSF
jgi:hypothetical protein